MLLLQGLKIKRIRIATEVAMIVVMFLYVCWTNLYSTVVVTNTCQPLSYYHSYDLQLFTSITTVSVEFFLPIIVFAVCYSSILHVVRGLKFNESQGTGNQQQISSDGSSYRVNRDNSEMSASEGQDKHVSTKVTRVDSSPQSNDVRERDVTTQGPIHNNYLTVDRVSTRKSHKDRNINISGSSQQNIDGNGTTTDSAGPITNQKPVVTTNNKKRNIRRGKLSSTEKNVLKTVALLNCSFILCWAPVQIYFFCVILSLVSPVPSAEIILICLVQVNFILNPVIYSLNLKQVRLGIRKAFKADASVLPFG